MARPGFGPQPRPLDGERATITPAPIQLLQLGQSEAMAGRGTKSCLTSVMAQTILPMQYQLEQPVVCLRWGLCSKRGSFPEPFDYVQKLFRYFPKPLLELCCSAARLELYKL